ncbi:hypothetical protein D5085_10355 [Ectothiorhodospiraceae bacterium BW-2]|nr:hypothetical protein D5085_10355 [Ectothiorhodospiraceae bacterium BW-2]
MKLTKKVTITVDEVEEIVCDRCGRKTKKDDELFEFQEYLSIEHECGYGSAISDETMLFVDLCQHCVKEMLLPIARMEEIH